MALAERSDRPAQVDAMADEIASHPMLVEAVSIAVTATIRSNIRQVVRAVLRDKFPGETLRLYCAAGDPARADRIVSALQRGLDPAAIAKAERVTPRTVRNVRTRLRGKIHP